MDYDQTERPPSQGIILNHLLGQAKSSAASGPDISEKKTLSACQAPQM